MNRGGEGNRKMYLENLFALATTAKERIGSHTKAIFKKWMEIFPSRSMTFKLINRSLSISLLPLRPARWYGFAWNVHAPLSLSSLMNFWKIVENKSSAASLRSRWCWSLKMERRTWKFISIKFSHTRQGSVIIQLNLITRTSERWNFNVLLSF